MHELWANLFLFSLLGLIVGLFKPNIMIFWSKNKTRKRVFILYGISTLIFLLFDFSTASPFSHKDATNMAISQPNIISNNIATTSNSNTVDQSRRDFDNFYQDFKKYHSGLEESFNHLQMALDKTTKGEVNPADFYTFLKATDNLFLVAWSDIDKKTPPKGLDNTKMKEVQQCIEYLSFSALTGKEAVEALMAGMNNPNSMEARSNFKNSIQKALTAHKAAGENIEKIKNELSAENK